MERATTTSIINNGVFRQGMAAITGVLLLIMCSSLIWNAKELHLHRELSSDVILLCLRIIFIVWSAAKYFSFIIEEHGVKALFKIILPFCFLRSFLPFAKLAFTICIFCPLLGVCIGLECIFIHLTKEDFLRVNSWSNSNSLQADSVIPNTTFVTSVDYICNCLLFGMILSVILLIICILVFVILIIIACLDALIVFGQLLEETICSNAVTGILIEFS